jgi:hypothetical protein
MTTIILQECITIIKGLVGHEYLYFDSAVEVKVTPHTPSFAAWAVSVSPAEELYVMDVNEDWHKLELSDNNAALVVGSLYQRLRMMRVQYRKAS